MACWVSTNWRPGKKERVEPTADRSCEINSDLSTLSSKHLRLVLDLQFSASQFEPPGATMECGKFDGQKVSTQVASQARYLP